MCSSDRRGDAGGPADFVSRIQNFCVEKRVEGQVVSTEERSSDSFVHDSAQHGEETAVSVATDAVLCAEEFSEFADTDVSVETEEKISENVELQEFESANTESYHDEVHERDQLGELMSSCWQPATRMDPCSDSESDISGSSSDASMTDIIPLLDELKHPVNLGSDHPSSTFRDRLDSSSDEEDDSEEDGDHGSDEGAEEKEIGENYSTGEDNFVDSSDREKVSNSLMEQRRSKGILKFELDKRLMDTQAADAIQKMEEASRFHVGSSLRFYAKA